MPTANETKTKTEAEKQAKAAARRAAIVSRFAPIDSGSIYTLEDFKNRTGLQKSAIRQMRRGGLVVKRIGRCRFVRGSDFADYMEKLAQSDA